MYLIWIVKAHRTFFNLSDHQAFSCAILIWKYLSINSYRAAFFTNKEVIVTKHSKGWLGPSLPPLVHFPEHFFPFRGQQCYYLPPLVTILQMREKKHQHGVGGVREWVLFVLSETVAAMWSKEHPMRLINLKTILPEIATATATTYLSVPFQELQLLFWLLWKPITILPQEFMIPTNVCCASHSGVSKGGMQTQGMEELTGRSWCKRRLQRESELTPDLGAWLARGEDISNENNGKSEKLFKRW